MTEGTQGVKTASRKFGLWRVLAWLSLACGVITYIVGWSSAMAGTEIWNVPTQVWFYDAIAAGIFAVFFLIYAVDADRRRAS